MTAQAPVPDNHPLMVAWKKYQQTDEFANSKKWALQIAPMVQAMDPDGEAKRLYDIMPREQRERHVQGSLWAAFMAGLEAASYDVLVSGEPDSANEAGR